MNADKRRCAVVVLAVVLAGCVATSKPAGLALRQVWAGPDVDVMGAASPHGRYLSYVDWETGDLALRDLATGKNRRLTNKGSWSHSSEYAEFSMPSPDGKQVAYAWHNREFFYELRVVGVDGSSPRVLYRRDDMEYIQPAAWFPDGKRIVTVFSRTGRTNQIAVVSAVDGSAQVLKSFDWRYPRLALSPDGRFLAYDFPPREESEERDIFLLASDGSSEIPLLAEPSNDRVLGWSPDGSRLLFGRETSSDWDLWTLPMSSGRPQGRPELVRSNMGPVRPLGVVRAGAFYYAVTSEMSELRVAALDRAGGQEAPSSEVLARLAAPAAAVAFSPDGRRLAYVSRPAGAGSRLRKLAIRELATREERELAPRIRIGPAGLLRWSPDGRFLLVATGIDEKGRRGLYRVDAQTGGRDLVARSQPGDYTVGGGWAAGGQAIYYVRNDAATGRYHVVAREMPAGREKEIHCGGASGAQVASALAASPDGRLLALVVHQRGTPSAAVLKIMPAAGGEPRELIRVPEPEAIIETSLAWTPDSREVLIARRASSLRGPTRLWRIPVQRGEARPVPLSVAAGLQSVSLHPDGRRLAFTTGPGNAAVWRMENWTLPLALPAAVPGRRP